VSACPLLAALAQRGDESEKKIAVRFDDAGVR